MWRPWIVEPFTAIGINPNSQPLWNKDFVQRDGKALFVPVSTSWLIPGGYSQHQLGLVTLGPMLRDACSILGIRITGLFDLPSLGEEMICSRFGVRCVGPPAGRNVV
jgi:hypothetical protein